MRVLAISGSLRESSHNTTLLQVAAKLLPPGVEVDFYDGLRDIPAYDEDLESEAGAPPAVERLRKAIAEADAVLVATPEYNGSVPGFLKNAFDWVSRPIATNTLRNKPVAVMGASTGMFGAVWSQAEMRKVLATIGARVVDRELPVPAAAQAFDARGRLRDPELESQLRELLGALRDEVADRERAVAAAA
jgi:chromate reductase, NAD(P)H dehydrogenase (quinone)